MFASSVEIHFRSPIAEGRSGMTSERTVDRSRTNLSSSDSDSEAQPSVRSNRAGGDLRGPGIGGGPTGGSESPFIACLGQVVAREIGTACVADGPFCEEDSVLMENPPPVDGTTSRVLREGTRAVTAPCGGGPKTSARPPGTGNGSRVAGHGDARGREAAEPSCAPTSLTAIAISLRVSVSAISSRCARSCSCRASSRRHSSSCWHLTAKSCIH